MKNLKIDLKDLYEIAYDFLLSQKEVDEINIKKHFKPMSRPKDFKNIFKGFCGSAQNKGMSDNVIGNSINGIENLGKVLYDFDPKLIVQNYSKEDNLLLLDRIIVTLKPYGKVRKTPRSLWPIYCRSIIEGAYFITKFESPSDFYKTIDKFVEDNRVKYAFPLMMSSEIYGFGLALACDFIKELGYENYGKPDTQLKNIFSSLGLIETKNKQKIQVELDVLKLIDEIAHINKVTPYQVDKIFWLIGSGMFSRTGIKVGSKRKQFIKMAKKYFKMDNKI